VRSSTTSREQEIQTVLVVEDDPPVLRALDRLLRAAGFEVRTFATPGALLGSKIPSTRACLIVDINLPEMNGVELCELLAATDRALPVILMTGKIDDPQTHRLIQRGNAIAVLYKPFSAELFFSAIAAAFLSIREPA
jgi:two-component system, LuxR family, response regulator FixJ